MGDTFLIVKYEGKYKEENKIERPIERAWFGHKVLYKIWS